MAYPVFDASSLPFVEDMFSRYQSNPAEVAPEWQAYFAGWLAAGQGTGAGGGSPAKALGVQALIQAWRTRGHRLAWVNPLLTDAPKPEAELMLDTYGLAQSDMDSMFSTDGVLPQAEAKLVDIFAALQRVYGAATGIETAQLTDVAQRHWVQAWWESDKGQAVPDAATRKALYTGLVEANAFEKFLHTKFVGAKRFSLEGTDAILPLLRQLIEISGSQGARHVVMGMAHRGRLNVLCNVMHKPLEELYAAFADTLTTEGQAADFSGDVKYHLGKRYAHKLAGGQEVDLELLFNPSHLEAVNPLVLGMAKARQAAYGAQAFETVVPVLMHGDSAVIGQGIVAECNNLMKLKPYDVGGTVHIVINNQIGFTADPVDAFSGEYCTDVFRGYGMPIVHVNADDLDACLRAVRFSMEFRRAFGRDTVIDLVGYRRWGHNEGDDPTFTQPVMYRAIKERPVAAEVYFGKLKAEGVLDDAAAEAVAKTYADRLNAAFATAQKGLKVKAKATAMKTGSTQTAVSAAALTAVAKAFQNVPPGAEINSKVKKVLDDRSAALTGQAPLNWGAAETAAYGTLLAEGIGWRLTGQDVQRGTFSHRHAVMTAAEDGAKWAPLAALATQGARHEVLNSALSENAVLGFEYGYAQADTQTLVMWEGQFGDFANGAQVVIDQFLAAAEAKWGLQNHVTVLLPHGYEGQGPEHSSARLERYLQLCAMDSTGGNMRVAMPSTPAQVFHLLRRQALLAAQGGPRKPLIVMTPKSLLRNPAAVSQLADLTGGSFQNVIADAAMPDLKAARRVVLCSGKVYYDLLAEREKTGRADVALIRVEELFPWPADAIGALLKQAKVKDVHWVQEEPRNMGAASYVRDQWSPEFGYLHIVSRPAAASPAVGTTAQHVREQAAILNQIFA